MPPNKRKRFSLALQDEYLVHLRQGMRRGAAAELLGFSRMKIIDFIEEHPAYEKKVLDAEGQANEHVEEALFQAAISGNVSAARAWMELRGGGHRPRDLDFGFIGPQVPADELSAPSPTEDDELFQGNVTRMDPRTRRKGA